MQILSYVVKSEIVLINPYLSMRHILTTNVGQSSLNAFYDRLKN